LTARRRVWHDETIHRALRDSACYSGESGGHSPVSKKSTKSSASKKSAKKKSVGKKKK